MRRGGSTSIGGRWRVQAPERIAWNLPGSLRLMQEYASVPSFQAVGAHWVAVLCDDTKASGLLRSLGGEAVVQMAQSVQERFVEFWCEWLGRQETGRRSRSPEVRATLARFIVASLAGIALMTFDPGDEVSGAMLDRLALMVETAEVNWVDGGQV